MEIKAGNNCFYIGENPNNPVALITFKLEENDKLLIDYTFVDPSLRGQGIAEKLLNEVIDYAKINNKIIIPLCSYAKYMMKNNKNN